MDYISHYRRLVERARVRVLTGYRERHHVLPRCMGGTDAPENLVDLTPEEHYVAHQLLIRMHPGNKGLIYAAICLAHKANGSRVYGWLRRRLSEANRGNKHGLGRKHSVESIAKMSAARVGRKRAAFSAEWRARIGKAASLTMQGKKNALGAKRSAETLAKMSAWQIGRTLSAEHRANMSAAKLGKSNGPHSAETRAKMSEARMAWHIRKNLQETADGKSPHSLLQGQHPRPRAHGR